MIYCTYDTKCQNPIIIEILIEEKEQLKKQIKDLESQLKDVIEDNDYYQKENERLKQKNAEYIKMLMDWEKLVCVNLSEGCCPSCEMCLFGELKEKTEGIERAE